MTERSNLEMMDVQPANGGAEDKIQVELELSQHDRDNNVIISDKKNNLKLIMPTLKVEIATQTDEIIESRLAKPDHKTTITKVSGSGCKGHSKRSQPDDLRKYEEKYHKYFEHLQRKKIFKNISDEECCRGEPVRITMYPLSVKRAIKLLGQIFHKQTTLGTNGNTRQTVLQYFHFYPEMLKSFLVHRIYVKQNKDCRCIPRKMLNRRKSALKQCSNNGNYSILLKNI